MCFIRAVSQLLVFLTIIGFLSPAFGQRSKPRNVRTERSSKAAIPNNADDKSTVSFGLTVENYASRYFINSDGTARQTIELQQRCSTDLCVKQFQKLEYAYNGDLQKTRLVDAYILRANGSKVPVKPENIHSRLTPQAEAAPGFSSMRELEISYEGVEVNDAIFYEIEIHTVKPMFENHFDTIEYFLSAFNWTKAEVEVTAPKEYPIYTEAIGVAGGKIESVDSRSRWLWTLNNVKAHEIEDAMYDLVGPSPRIVISTFSSYDQLGSAFWSNVKKKAVVTPEAQKLADEITKGISDPKLQSIAIYDWVNKNIRYLLVVLDRGGWIPHSTSEILANRYGDCKDYTTIIYALLKAKGIDSIPMLIRSEFGDWFPAIPAPEYFNHAVLYIPSLDIVADATAPNTRLGLIPQTLVGKKGVLSGERTGILEIPKDDPDKNQIISTVEIRIDSNGDLKALSKNIYDGRTEIIFRPIFADSVRMDPELFVKVVMAYFGFPGSGKVTKISDAFNVGMPFSVEMEMALPNFTTFLSKGSLTLPVGVNLTNTLGLEAFTKSETRRTNLIAGAMRVKETFVIHLPDSVKVGQVPQPVVIKNDIGEYRNEFRVADNVIEVVRELVIRRDVIEPKDYGQFRELIKIVVEGHNRSFEYSADPSLTKRKPRTLSQTGGKSKAPSIERVIDELFNLEPEREFSSADIRRLEAKLIKAPNDLETRKSLVRHYSGYDKKDTPLRIKNRLAHRLWFVRNQPEMDEYKILGILTTFDDKDTEEYKTLAGEWLKQVGSNKENSTIRLNAVAFFRGEDNALAKKLLLEMGGTRQNELSISFFDLSGGSR